MLGGLIKRYDPTVDMLFLARGEHGRRMRESGGVELHGPWGRCHVPVRVSDRLADLAGSSVVLLGVKSQDTEEVAQKASEHLGRAVVVSVQNGINQRVLSNHVSPKRLVVGMTATNMAIVAPGVVSLQRNGITVVGAGTEQTPSTIVEQAEAVLAKSRLAVRSERNVLGVQYNKLLMNTMGYASVLSDSNFITEGILDRGWRRAVAMPILAEGLRVLDNAGIELVRTPGLSDVLRFRRLLATIDAPPVAAVLRLVLTKLVVPKRIVYSVYQDLVRGRKTEIDFVNGEIVRLAETHGTEAPLNATVVEMVRELERREPGSFFSRENVVSRFEGIARRQSL